MAMLHGYGNLPVYIYVYMYNLGELKVSKFQQVTNKRFDLVTHVFVHVGV